MTQHRRRVRRCAFLLAAVAGAAGARAEPRLSDAVNVFVGGVGYPNYRTPSITAMPDGSLVAVAEGRTFDDPGFGGDLDIVSKRSTDGGQTWGPMQVIDAWAGGTNSNPTTVLDRMTNRLFLLYNRWEGNHGTTDSQPGTTNNTAWMRYSDNGGATWSNAADITAGVKDFNNWNTVSFGPGSGIQASNGRLIIPSARWVNGWQPYAAYSNDHGATWTRGSLVPGGNLAGENQLVQLADGRILLEARPNISGPNTRLTTTSLNGGLTWAAMTPGQNGPESQMSIERFTLASAGDDQNRIVFTGPKGPDARQDLIVRTSYDEAQTWANERLLYDGYSGYSDITIFPDKSIGVFFETNEARSLTFVKLNREWIEPPQRLKAFEGFNYNTQTLGTKNGGLLWNTGWSGSPTTLSGTPTAKMEAADLSYTNFPFAIAGKRRAFFNQGGSMARALPAAVNLNTNQTYFLSMLLRQDIVNVVETETDQEALDVLLYAGASRQASFGVHGNESFYIDVPGFGASTAADSMDKNAVYYLVAKIVAHDAASGLSDQLYLKAFKTGDAVPATDSTLGWTLATTPGFNSTSVIDRIALKGGALADWVVDEFRFGTSFGSVVSNVLAYKWDVNAGGNWSSSANWLDGAPNAAGQTATFGNVITAPRTVTLDAPQTVGHVLFDSAQSYTIAGSPTLQFSTPGTASITVAQGNHTIAVPISMTSSTTATVAAGSTLTLSGASITTGAGATLTKSGDGKLELTHLRGYRLAVDAGTAAIIATGGGTAAGTSKLTSLVINTGAGARLDLRDNKLITEDAAGAATGGVYSGLQGAVQSASNFGVWDGPGLTTSMPDAIAGLTTIGVATGAQVRGLGPTDTDTFAGQTITGASTIAMYTYAGDANLDGTIDGGDYGIIDNFVQVPNADGYANGDFNYDGVIDGGDYGIIDNNVQAQGAPFPTGCAVGLSGVTAIPEPAACGLAGLTAAVLTLHRRMRKRQCP
jgi:sialidase-1